MVVRYDLNEDNMGVERVLEVLSCSSSSLDVNSPDEVSDISASAASTDYVPTIRSGSFADIGPVRSMEDEHVTIDDLSVHLGSLFRCPKPSAFYGIFDGHGGPEASAFLRTNATRLFFEDSNFPQSSKVDEMFLEKVENALRKAFLLADLALAEDQAISNSVGAAALTVLILGRFLMVANAGDCRAVLCRKGEAIEMSQDHRPVCPAEKRRVEEMGGYIDNGYLNGILSLTRALGDWDMKLPVGSASPLISDPELRHIVLTEEDEFLIIGCDGIWDVLSSQEAVKLVRCGLRRHNDPERCARDLARAALGLRTFDNLTAIVVCLSNQDGVGVDCENKQKLWRPRFRNSESCLF